MERVLKEVKMKTGEIIFKISQRVNILIKNSKKRKDQQSNRKMDEYMNRNGTEKKKCRWTVEITECAPLFAEREGRLSHRDSIFHLSDGQCLVQQHPQEHTTQRRTESPI